MKDALVSSQRIPFLSDVSNIFANFTVVVDRRGGKMTFFKNLKEET